MYNLITTIKNKLTIPTQYHYNDWYIDINNPLLTLKIAYDIRNRNSEKQFYDILEKNKNLTEIEIDFISYNDSININQTTIKFLEELDLPSNIKKLKISSIFNLDDVNSIKIPEHINTLVLDDWYNNDTYRLNFSEPNNVEKIVINISEGFDLEYNHNYIADFRNLMTLKAVEINVHEKYAQIKEIFDTIILPYGCKLVYNHNSAL